MAAGCAERGVFGHVRRDRRFAERHRPRRARWHRAANTCSAFQTFPPVLVVDAPACNCRELSAGGAQFGAAAHLSGCDAERSFLPTTGRPTRWGWNNVRDGCQPFVNGAAIAGNIALVDRGVVWLHRESQERAECRRHRGRGRKRRRQRRRGRHDGRRRSDDYDLVRAASASVPAARSRARCASGVNVTLRIDTPAVTDQSYRWLTGEELAGLRRRDSRYVEPHLLRRSRQGVRHPVPPVAPVMGVASTRIPACPIMASRCSIDGGELQRSDGRGDRDAQGGAHLLSGDDGLPGSGERLADHADALQQSCTDLTGQFLAGFDGVRSLEAVTPFDCAQNLRDDRRPSSSVAPTQCNFQPLLSKNAPR